jgi:FkbM family methyltransferase
MIKWAWAAYKVFDLLVKIIDKQTRYNYTMIINYEGCKLLIRPLVDFIEMEMVSGRWEPYVKAILDKEVKSGDVVADVGANIGIYAVPLAKRVSKVIAFEPHPKTSEMLETSIKLNQLSNIMLIKRAVGEKREKVLLDISSAPAFSNISSSNTLDQGTGCVEIESIDLDTALAMENRLDWLLVDIEGFEVNALNGARKTLETLSPKIIVETYHNHKDEVSTILTNEGYSITLLFSHKSGHEELLYYYAIKRF